MEPIDAGTLPELPAPFWFIQLFKVLGFTLHMVPMHLWYAGMLVALWLYGRGPDPGRRFATRLLAQMPVLMAFGINLGIVPLLFLQVAYCRAFYPATILMAWFWLAIVVLLIPAYYGVYYHSAALASDGAAMTRLRRASGWTAAVLFVVIGFLFANGLSLTTRDEAWHALWAAHNVGGAATGTALNLSDATLWPRWLLMFGLALVTTAAWCVLDAVWLSAGSSDDDRRFARDFALKLSLAGAVWSTVAGAWYVFLAWPAEVFREMFSFPAVLLTLVTAASPWFPSALLFAWRQGDLNRSRAAAIAGTHLGVLALNAISRQIVQNIELRSLFQPGVSYQPVATQWDSLVLFLATFLGGVVVIAWILAQLAKVPAKQ
ncbi:MAG: hypothetical protein NUV77_18800 [Thermoguttaceae bacterium]|jgi:hypothetical protein|nr:hypothetical protein [Thermoguttaceae bacterium]